MVDMGVYVSREILNPWVLVTCSFFHGVFGMVSLFLYTPIAPIAEIQNRISAHACAGKLVRTPVNGDVAKQMVFFFFCIICCI